MRMRSILGALLLALPSLACISLSGAHAAGNPSIDITSPRNGTILHGTSVSLSVSVSHFRLVPPLLRNAPILKGNTGNIEYALDAAPQHATANNFSASRSHRWKGVAPGRHTLWAFLVTTQMVPFPTARPAHVTVVVAPAAGPRPVRKPPIHAGGPGVSAGPRTGGGAGLGGNPLNLSLLFAGIAALIVGLAFLGRRFAFASISGSDSDGESGGIAGVPVSSSVGPESSLPAEMDGAANSEHESAASALPTEAKEDDLNDPVTNFPTPMTVGMANVENEPAPSELPTEAKVAGFNDPAINLPTPMAAEEEPEAEAQDAEPAPDESLPATASPPAGVLEEQHENPIPEAPRPMGTSVRDRAVAMAQQWASVVEGLVRQLDDQEAERRDMLERIHQLESKLQAAESRREEVWEQLRQRIAGSISGDDLSSVRYVTDSLLRDPDHIVVLASVAQNAGKLHELVESYVGMRQALESL